jgi:hypothetical protein
MPKHLLTTKIEALRRARVNVWPPSAGAAGSGLTLAGAVKRRWKRRFDSGRRSAARDASATPLCTLAIGERLENNAAND